MGSHKTADLFVSSSRSEERRVRLALETLELLVFALLSGQSAHNLLDLLRALGISVRVENSLLVQINC